MTSSNNPGDNVRLCQLCIWPEYSGLGFNLEGSTKPPHFIRLVESNSPAAAGGLKILDVILAVNQQDVAETSYENVRKAIKNARDSGGPIELLVIEQRFYQQAKKRNLPIKRSSPVVIKTPPTMPASYRNFPKNQPRTCTINLSGSEKSFGFEVVNADNDIGAYIQEVFPNTPASRTSLQKSDRIIEVDDKFVDKDLSKSILDKIGKAKEKGAVKLYVMDTETYKNFLDNKKSLQSKKNRRSQSEDSLSTVDRRDTAYLSNATTPREFQSSAASTLNNNTTKTRTPSVPDLTRVTNPPAMITPLPQVQVPTSIREDIRLCTINRADPEDVVGIELNYHRRERFHSLSVIPGRDNGPSNAQLAGVRSDDRLIEINGENIQSRDHDEVTDLIRSVKYPEPLRMLVADVATYDNYRQQGKKIHQNLPNVQVLPPNDIRPTRSSSPSSRRSADAPSTTTTTRNPLTNSTLQTFNRQQNPSPSTRTNPTMITTSSTNDFQARQIPIKKDSLLSNGVGFNFRTVPNDPKSSSTPYSHIITSVDSPNSIGTQGLRVNDHIISVNDELVEYLNHDQLEEKLRRAPNSEMMRLLVADGAVYRAYKQSNSPASNFSDPTHVRSSPLNNTRRHVLRLTPNFEGYGFRVRSNYQSDGTPHQIVSVEPNSPADHQGLRVGDYILRVNNQTVEHLDSVDFNKRMETLIRDNQTRDGALVLEVMDEATYRRNQTPTSPYRTYTPTNEISPTIDSDEPYPKMRLCFVRLWPNYQDLGFVIANSPTGGYVVQQLRLDSPAAHTHVRNGDHLIQVNNINVETTDPQYVQQLLHDSVRRDGSVSLLLIDDPGYQWYKRNHYRIDPLSQRANVNRHVTPEQQAVYTSTDSTTMSPFGEQMLDQREIQLPSIPYHPTSTIQSRPPSTGPPTIRPYPYANGFIQTPREQNSRPNFSPSVTSSLSRPRTSLTRAAVDVVDGKSMIRVCTLIADPGQNFGFELAQDENKHIIRNVKPDSPAARGGLHNEDRLICVNDTDVTQRSHRDVVGLIKSQGNNGTLRLTISPSTVRPMNKPSGYSKTKSLPSLNDDRIYQSGNNQEFYNNGWSPYEAPVGTPQNVPPMVKYMSTSRIDHAGVINYPYPERPYSALGHDTYRQQTHRSTSLASQPYSPTDPWPRKCVLVRDPAFQGCGFRMIEKENYDTPIVVEVRPNSPAKRSGLTEGDHIIYIDNRNVQAVRTFDQMTKMILEIFEETGQVTLVTLTGPGYQCLKRKGGYLQPDPFEYQLPFVRELSPRLCKIVLHNHEQDFGFTLQRGNPIHIKDVHPSSAAYEHGLRMNDKILEINGRDTVLLSSDQIIEIIESSKRRRQLDLLVIDTAGYEFSIKHAIPLNSLLPFVQTPQRRASSTRRNQQEPVYL